MNSPIIRFWHNLRRQFVERVTHLLDGAGLLGGHDAFHLHSLDHKQGLIFLYLLADLHQNTRQAAFAN